MLPRLSSAVLNILPPHRFVLDNQARIGVLVRPTAIHYRVIPPILYFSNGMLDIVAVFCLIALVEFSSLTVVTSCY